LNQGVGTPKIYVQGRTRSGSEISHKGSKRTSGTGIAGRQDPHRDLLLGWQRQSDERRKIPDLELSGCNRPRLTILTGKWAVRVFESSRL